MSMPKKRNKRTATDKPRNRRLDTPEPEPGAPTADKPKRKPRTPRGDARVVAVAKFTNARNTLRARIAQAEAMRTEAEAQLDALTSETPEAIVAAADAMAAALEA
jgi:hypothetical protein